MVASEVAPFAKTGGLADMVWSLSSALVDLGHDVRIVFPHYPSVEGHALSTETVNTLAVQDGTEVRSVVAERIHATHVELHPPPRVGLYTIRHDEYFGRPGLYQESGRDYPDNLARFALFCRAALELVERWSGEEAWAPNIIHVHDWQAGLVPVYLKTRFAARSFSSTVRTIMTLHNIGYQGIFPSAQYPVLGLDWTEFTAQRLEFYGSINLLKGGIVFADFLTTVSPTYCREIQTPDLGFGLDDLLHARRDRLVGIVNGIDTVTWNPETDPWLPENYSVTDLRGKATCKAALQRESGLALGDGPLLGVVSRLVSQKGIDLVIEAAPEIVQNGGQLVVLGTGESELEEKLRTLEQRYADRIKIYIGFDEGLAHRIQAGADVLMVPSRYEPCGLTQLCSLRYGTVPLVRKTGGLADTVIGFSKGDHDTEGATGFVFDQATAGELADMIQLAVSCYANKSLWRELQLHGMKTNVGWNESAKRYEELYRRAVESPDRSRPGNR